MRKSLLITREAFFITVLFSVFFLPITSWAATLSASPSNVAQGGAVTATWGAVAAPTNGDWIGLFSQGAGDGSYRDWIYVSCTKSMGGSSVNGSCSFAIPGSLANGTYELRLFSNDGFTRLATSGPINVSPTPPPSTRFVDNGDGTVTDNQTKRMWGIKTGVFTNSFLDLRPCITLSDCPDPHNVNNTYVWSSSGVAADGPLFTDFLERVNGNLCDSSNCRGLGGHTDWRIPTLAELQTIFCSNCEVFPLATCGMNSQIPCIQTSLLIPSGGMPSIYWTSSTFSSNLSVAFIQNFRIDRELALPNAPCGQTPVKGQFIECSGKSAGLPAFAVRDL